MVEHSLYYNLVFHALADETRRDILLQLNAGEKTISEIAIKYSMSFAAIAKHLKILEAATLVFKRKRGREQIVSANPQAVSEIAKYLKQYETMWDQRFNNLENILKEK
jgi:DNA-binding transcriptional ArsR family regulator